MTMFSDLFNLCRELETSIEILVSRKPKVHVKHTRFQRITILRFEDLPECIKNQTIEVSIYVLDRNIDPLNDLRVLGIEY